MSVENDIFLNLDGLTPQMRDNLTNLRLAIYLQDDNNTDFQATTDGVTLNNYNATAAPTVNDDSGSGYGTGSKWVDETNDKAYILLDPTPEAAIWTEIDDTDDVAIHDNVAAEINAITEKESPVAGDWGLLEDSAASNAKKKYQLGNLPAGTPSFAELFQATLSGNQSIPNADMTKADFDTVTYQASTNWSVANKYWVCPATGKYPCSYRLRYAANATGRRGAYIYINGTVDDAFVIPTPGTWYARVGGFKVLNLTADDYVEIHTYQDSGGALNIESHAETFFQIFGKIT